MAEEERVGAKENIELSGGKRDSPSLFLFSLLSNDDDKSGFFLTCLLLLPLLSLVWAAVKRDFST